ncbi:MAG TPA: hypothetical protein VG101_04620 [Puia sp.]|nr:hypothetical protein [Puia sp.]
MTFSICLTACRAGPCFPPGGYPYPEKIADKDTDFYLSALKGILSKRDSFQHIGDYFGFRKFDEPNLSLRPLKTPEFRFYQPGYLRYDDLLIVLTPQTLTVKRHKADNERFTTDSARISPLDHRLIEFMQRHFGRPRPDSSKRPLWYRYIDSMENQYPQLKDPAYYVRTIKKELIPDTTFLPYQSSTRAITQSEYQLFIDSLNASGYWHLPYVRECHEGIAVDGPSYFSLEANTPDQYNFVSGYPCPNDTNLFYKACQHLARLAGLEKEIDLLWIEVPPDTTQHKKPIVVEDVQFEDVKEPRKPHHPKKLHPNSNK